MFNTYYKIYLADVFSLVRSLAIKVEGISTTLNQELRQQGYPVSEADYRSWKYYLNLNGEYHASDRIMTVRSMDTLELIEFTKQNLRVHRATAREYQPGSRYYDALVKRYPEQSQLIRGILAPVDPDVAYAAQDGTILSYDTKRVESNEDQLIPELQKWLYFYFGRWYNAQYEITDDLYLPAFLGQLYLQLPSRIQTLRLAACKTNHAHSFHIREYLASNGRLDVFLTFLTKKQQLFLYRNIRYLNRHLGKQETFDVLVEHLLTERGLPLASYTLKQQYDKLPENIYPDVVLQKNPINFGYNQTRVDTTTIDTILKKERPLARDNHTVEDEASKNILRHTQRNIYSELPTKVLESEVIDRSESSVRSLDDVLVNHWLYLASTERYTAYINVANPATGENMTLSVRDAFIVAYRSWHQAYGLDAETIPSFQAYGVLRAPLPTLDDLKSVVDPRYVSDAMLNGVLDLVQPLGEYISTEGFYEACVRFHAQYLKLWEYYSLQEHYLTRGLLEQAVNRLYQHIRCTFEPSGTTYEQWCRARGLDILELDQLDSLTLYNDCVRFATGANLVNRVTLNSVQQAMLQVFEKLSSYSVQYLRTISFGQFWYVGTPTIRLGDIDGVSRTREYVVGPNATVLKYRGRARSRLNLSDVVTNPSLSVSARSLSRKSYDPRVPIKLKPTAASRVRLNVADVGIRHVKITVRTTSPDDNDLGQYGPST